MVMLTPAAILLGSIQNNSIEREKGNLPIS